MLKWIPRNFDFRFDEKVKEGKIVVIYGPRRAGKTSFIENLLSTQSSKIYKGTGDDIELRKVLSSENKSLILSSFVGYDTLFIDEAQRIPSIGWGLKLLIDQNPKLQIIVTGSSSFELSGEISEPLTGRAWTFLLPPISVKELSEWEGNMKVRERISELLIFGSYPEVINAEGFDRKKDYLTELKNAYLFKDILELENIRNSSKLIDLLKLLAFQIGAEVSLNELSNSLGIAKQTVEKYLDLLEKTFVIYKLRGFSKNLRKEVTKTARYIFVDNGIRNTVIHNFNLPDTRNDLGGLWENFCLSERLKKQRRDAINANNYFWRTYDQQEIDLIEERDGSLFAFEFKWNPKKKTKQPAGFKKAYPNASYTVVSPDNFFDFLL